MEGRIVTAGHCVETLDDKITAIDIYGHKHAATPIYDNDKTDVAVLSVTNLDVSNLYLDSSDLVSGDQVVTLGWPFYSRPTGKLAFEVGYILGDIRDGVLRRILATDCTARGMSGGPVLRNGQVIGLVSAVLPQTDMYDYSGHMSIKNISIFATADAIREALNETDSTTDIN
jgi:S1-C subfamily serine protease